MPFSLFRCPSCGWRGVRGSAASRCSDCDGRLILIRPCRPRRRHDERDTEVVRLQAIVRSLAERCFVQSECLQRIAERKEA